MGVRAHRPDRRGDGHRPRARARLGRGPARSRTRACTLVQRARASRSSSSRSSPSSLAVIAAVATGSPGGQGRHPAGRSPRRSAAMKCIGAEASWGHGFPRSRRRCARLRCRTASGHADHAARGPCRGLRLRAHLPGRADATGTSAGPASGSGTARAARRRRRSTPCTPRWRCSPGSRAAAAVHTEEIWRGLTGGSVGAPHRLARRVGDLPQDDAPRRRHGPGPRGLLGGQQLRKASRPAGAAAAAGPHRGRGRRRGPRAVRRDRRRRGQRPQVTLRRPRDAERGRLRRVPAAHRQRPGGRAAAGQGRPAGDQGQPSPATGPSTPTAPSPPAGSPWSRGSTPWRPSWPSDAGRPAGPRRCCPAAASSSSTPTVTPELAQEGLARDIVRAVQQARRDAGLRRQRPDQPDRRRATRRSGRPTVAHQSLIVEETLATQFGVGAGRSTPCPRRCRPSTRSSATADRCASWCKKL